MTAAFDEFACYVPTFIQEWLAQAREPPVDMRAEQFSAALLFADVSGFTPLANKLARLGPEGAEELDRLLNVYYAPLVDLVYGHGGDVVAYAGDAALAIWPATSAALPEALLRATNCGLEMQGLLNQFAVDRDVRLSMKVCLAAGSITAGYVGGLNGVWQPLVTGDPLHQIRALGELVKVGDVLLSAEAKNVAGSAVHGEALAGGHLRVAKLEAPPLAAPLAPTALSPSARSAVRSFVSPTVLSRIDAGQSKWLADLRPATVAFVSLGGIDSREARATERLHVVMQLLQREMARFEGQVVQLLEDDKGIVAIFCFGLPPFMHEDDPYRAVQAALVVQRELARLGLAAGIGVSTGRVFSGPRGSARRREYSITGHIVNLAARLAGKSQGGILCDEATQRSAASKATFETLEPLNLKGVPQPVSVFRPTGKSASGRSRDERLAGRDAELQAFTNLLQTPAKEAGQVLLVEGEPGIGKSVLLAAFRQQGAESGFRTATGFCNTVEQTTPYFPWRSILAEALHISDATDLEQRRRAVLDRLQFDAALEARATLLNAVLELDLPESDLVAQMPGNARADNLHELIHVLLRGELADRRMLVFLDDVQWMDDSSWRLALYLVQRFDSLLLVLGARPLETWDAAECRQLLDRGPSRQIQLGALTREDLGQFVRARVGSGEPSPQLLDYVYERSHGNPFHAEELLGYLDDCRLLVRRGETCELAPWIGGAGAAAVPGSLRALITGRIDRLAPQQQMALKTGSVIGRAFPKRTLAAVYEVPEDLALLDEHLERVRNVKLIEIEPQPELTYFFRHVTIQQVVYDQIPRQNRRALHLAIAKWYEREFGPAAAHLRLLAHHWGQAGRPDREMEYLAKSGEIALINFANREAAESFQTALDRQMESAGGDLDESRRRERAHWERQLGEAHFQLGNLPDAQLHLEQALVLLERPAASGKARVAASILWQILRQATHRFFPRLLTSSSHVESSEEAAGGLHETALAFQRLSQLHYLTVEMPLGLARALRALNLAERAGKSPLLARAYSGMSLVTGMLRFHRLAERYANLAEQTAREIGNMPTLAYALMTAGVYRLGVGKWDRVAEAAKESIALAEKLGDLHQLGHMITMRAMLRCLRAEYEAAAQDYEEVKQVAVRSENVVLRAWSYSGRGECLFRLGQIDESIECFHETLRLLSNMEHRTEDIRMHGMLAAAHLARGEHDLAWSFAEKTMQIISQGSYATVSTLEGFDGAAAVCLARFEAEPTILERRGSAELALRHLRWYAKVYPVGRPRWFLARGRLRSILGQSVPARRDCEQAQKEAHKYGLPLEERLARERLT